MVQKRVLLLRYSQTGQTREVSDRIIAPLRQAGIRVDCVDIQPRQAYPFPWPFLRFLEVFPEAVQGIGPTLDTIELSGADDYALVILAYPVWYLSPALPIASFLNSPQAQALLIGKPVITVVTARNMWVMAQQSVAQKLSTLGARLLDHIALVDPSPALITFITTLRWIVSGKRQQQPLGLPDAGLAVEQIAQCRRFGLALVQALAMDQEQHGAALLRGLEACRVDPAMAVSEKIGFRSFYVWSLLLCRIGPQGSVARRLGVLMYLCILITLICTVVPITMLLRKLVFALSPERAQAMQAALELPSGNGSERMTEFAR
jgi:hypothetical protein